MKDLSSDYPSYVSRASRDRANYRTYAFLLDKVIVSVGVYIAVLVSNTPWWLPKAGNYPITKYRFNFEIVGWFFIADCLYCALLESSVWQATLGKKLFGLYVTDLEGKRISFFNAIYRYLLKQLAMLFYFFLVTISRTGVIVNASPYFHDVTSKTQVVKRDKRKN